MKTITKIVATISVVVAMMLLATLPIFAATPNVGANVTKEELEPGDTFVLTIGSDEMTVTSFVCGVRFDTNVLEVTKRSSTNLTYYDVEEDEDVIKSYTARATAAEANANGSLGITFAGTADVTYNQNTAILTITFKVKDGARGTTQLTIFEKSDGTDGYNADVEVVTLTIGSSEPSCDHKLSGDYQYTSNNDGTHDYFDKCECGDNTEEGTENCTYVNGECKFCGFDCQHSDATTPDHICDICGEPIPNDVCYDTDNDGNHNCDVCGKTMPDAECSDKDGDGNHNCDECGKADVTAHKGGTANCQSPAICEECGAEYGAKDATKHTKGTIFVNNGETHTEKYECCGATVAENQSHDFTAGNCVCGAEKPQPVYTGWTELADGWYYFDANHEAVTGIARVPYPTEAINGKTYVADAETIDYCNERNEEFIDADTALFVFDKNGKFNAGTGLVEYKNATRYAKDGMLVWHPGFVEVEDELYYFIGDVVEGGNIPADGDIYLVRVNGYDYTVGNIYNFVSGQLSGKNGIVDGKYYEDSQLMIGAGLKKLTDGYVYVRSNGEVAIGDYWVTKTNGICKSRMFSFDKNGYAANIVDPSINGIYNGFYYENGETEYAGLIVIDGETYYVKSNGQLATGYYYVTKIDGYTGDLNVKVGERLNFGVDGKLVK